MKAWLRQHRMAFALAVRRLVASPFGSFLSLLAIGVALALPMAGFTAFANLQRLAGGSGTTPQISVFMRLDADRDAADAIEARLDAHAGIQAVEFLPRETTRSAMGEAEGLSDVIDALPRNPFPDAFIVTPANTDVKAMEQLADEIRGWPRVEHVQIDSVWVGRLNAMLRLGRAGVAVLALLLGLGVTAITFNTIRLQIYASRREIEVSRLLGATNAFVRRPYFYLGAIQGLLGALFATLLVVLATLALRAPVLELTTQYGLNRSIAMPDPLLIAEVAVAAMTLGWLGTLLSVNRYLHAGRLNFG